MKTIEINITKEIGQALPQFLYKDLQDNERICPTCHGLGVITVKNPYGLKNDNSERGKQSWYPYERQAFSFCPNCYNGVQRLCKYCGKPIQKGRTDKCDCEEYKREERKKEKLKHKKLIENAECIDEKDVNTYLYCEENDKYYGDSDEFIKNWKDEHDKNEAMPSILWVTTECDLDLDASSILESATEELHEDAYENCDADELQTILDEYAERQTGTKTFYPDYKQYIKINS